MTDHEVTIIGAGFGGMGAAIALKRLGYGSDSRSNSGGLLILEREDDLGGTWHVNHYPGLAVDIASVTYSYSFEPNPYWQHWFARGSELKQYAEHVADTYDLRRHMRFGVSVEGARWDEDEQHWVVATSPMAPGSVSEDGSRQDTPGLRSERSERLETPGLRSERSERLETPGLRSERSERLETPGLRSERSERLETTFTTRYLLTATGFLSQPRLPDIEGVHDFAGEVIHTAKWDDDADLTGKRVAVIGTGATAVQLIPEIADVAEQLTVFQRTPIWVTPKTDFRIPRFLQRLFTLLPWTQRLARKANGAWLEALMVSAVLNYRQARIFNRAAAALSRRHLRKQVADPELRRKLTPDYSFGCKRPTFSDDYFPTFTRDHVTLETTSIERITEGGIVTADGRERPIDTLVLATGFNLWDANFPAIEVIGREGLNLGKWWREHGYSAYEGVTVPQFPNFVTLNSPYSYSGLSYFMTIEVQMRHLERLFGEVGNRGARTFEISERANEEFLGHMLERMDDTVFNLGACSTSRSYYFTNEGDAVILRPTSSGSARKAVERFPISDYEFG